MLCGSYMSEASELNQKPVQAVVWQNCVSWRRLNKGLFLPGVCSWISLCSWLYFRIKNCSKMSTWYLLEAQCVNVIVFCMSPISCVCCRIWLECRLWTVVLNTYIIYVGNSIASGFSQNNKFSWKVDKIYIF